jgi:hypothetical protein
VDQQLVTGDRPHRRGGHRHAADLGVPEPSVRLPPRGDEIVELLRQHRAPFGIQVLQRRPGRGGGELAPGLLRTQPERQRQPDEVVEKLPHRGVVAGRGIGELLVAYPRQEGLDLLGDRAEVGP